MIMVVCAALAGLFALSAIVPATAPMAATAQVPAASPAAPRPATIRVALVTSFGPITLELEKDRAPITTANFLHYVDTKRLDGMTFYRAMHYGADGGLVQGGVRDPRLIDPPIAHEPTSLTGIRHEDATISMARGVPGSAQADFFITVGAIPALDADPALPGDNLGFAAFGHVVDGMDVVRRILAQPISATLGEGAMKGQMIAAPVRIVSARRIAAGE
ncbi:peptidylprolyl isomerase [Sphingomonas sp.]|uniref:peptidylprolyl isomerase n=1 Tax=Sphingomonas sp. TaxID=28214 RepID=UPI002ED7A042